jgi:hypothetical protein
VWTGLTTPREYRDVNATPLAWEQASRLGGGGGGVGRNAHLKM